MKHKLPHQKIAAFKPLKMWPSMEGLISFKRKTELNMMLPLSVLRRIEESNQGSTASEYHGGKR